MEASTLFATHPIRLRITDDLRRTRLTVFFRLLLAIPLFLWAALLGIVAALAIIANWFATLFAGKSPEGLHNFLANYLRFTTQIAAYCFLIADPYPGFLFINMEEYPVDLEVAPPEVQNRWTVLFRIILAIPALLIASVLRNISSLLAVFSWVMGVLTAAGATGQLVFLPLMAWLAEQYGWRSASLVVSVAALAVVPLVLIFVRNYPADLGVRAYGAEAEPLSDKASTGDEVRPGHLAGGDDGELTQVQLAQTGAVRRTIQTLFAASKKRTFWALVAGFAICGATTNGLIGTHFVPAAHDHGMPLTTAGDI